MPDQHKPAGPAIFLEGSILRHVLVMTATGSVGLVAIFFVDLLTLIYISWLGDANMTAGIGIASQLSFLFLSIQIGFSIAVTAMVSQALGRGDREEAVQAASGAILLIAIMTAALSLLVVPFRRELAALIGARGETLDHAAHFMLLTFPSNAFLAVGMSLSGVMRAAGDARRSMYVTLGGAIVISIMDPILILLLRWDVTGAALSTVASRMAFAAIGLWGAAQVHGLVRPVSLARALRHLRPLLRIALPAMLTTMAAPVANIYALRVYASFGDAILAGFAIVDRIVPVAFGALFALSGSVGPIVGQNFGARRFDRVAATLTNCYAVAAVYGLAMWIVLWIASGWIVWLFGATGRTAEFVVYFCQVGAGGWMFLGWLFAANAAFNNLGYGLVATLFNWGRATLGVIPFVTLGAAWGGAHGALLGVAVGGGIFGAAALAASYRVVARLARRYPPA